MHKVYELQELKKTPLIKPDTWCSWGLNTLSPHYTKTILIELFVQLLVALSVDFCAVFCRPLFVILSLYYFGYCVVLLELRFLIISWVMLVSSNRFFLVNFN